MCVCFVCVTFKLCVFMFLCVFYEVVCNSRPLFDVSFWFRQRSPPVTPGGFFRRTARSVAFCISFSLSVCVSVLHFKLCVVCFCVFMRCVKFRPRIANWMGEDSCCRGGIVHIRCGCSCARLARPKSPKALWRFCASTSNSPSGRSRPHTYTQIRYIDQTYAQQDIRVHEDDHLKPPIRQFSNPKELWLLRVSI